MYRAFGLGAGAPAVDRRSDSDRYSSASSAPEIEGGATSLTGPLSGDLRDTGADPRPGLGLAATKRAAAVREGKRVGLPGIGARETSVFQV